MVFRLSSDFLTKIFLVYLHRNEGQNCVKKKIMADENDSDASSDESHDVHPVRARLPLDLLLASNSGANSNNDNDPNDTGHDNASCSTSRSSNCAI